MNLFLCVNDRRYKPASGLFLWNESFSIQNVINKRTPCRIHSAKNSFKRCPDTCESPAEAYELDLLSVWLFILKVPYKLFVFFAGSAFLSAVFLALATYQSLYPLTLFAPALLYLLQVGDF